MLKHVFRSPTVKQFGLPRTGTNYCRFLLERNYQVEVLVDKEGWKHGYLSPMLHPCRMCVMLSKDPFAWFTSALRLYRHYMLSTYSVTVSSLGGFLRSKFIIGDRGCLLSFKNPIDCWNVMTRHWLSIPYTGRNFIAVRYEDLVKTPEETLGFIAKRFRLVRKIGDFENTAQTLGMSSDNQNVSQRSQAFDPAYYLERKYMSLYTPEQIAYVNERLEKALLKKLKYQLE